MDRIITSLRREPVRARLYSLAALVAGYLVARGVITPSDAEFIVGVGVLVLGVESTRSKVSPTA